MQLETIIILLIISLNLLLGLIVLLSNYKKTTNRYFFLLVVFLSIWISSNFWADQTQNQYFGAILTKIDFASALFAIAFLMLFSFDFPEANKKFKPLLKWCVILFSIFLSAISLSDLMISVKFNPGGISFEPLPFFYLYLLTIISFVVISLVNFILNLLKASIAQRKQTKFVLIGIFLTLAAALFSNFVLPYFIDKDNITFTLLSRIGVFGTIFFSGFTAYAIIKHQLFDIKIILAETVIVVVMLILLFQTLFSKTISVALINSGVLLVVAYGGYLIIKSILNEIKQKEQLQIISVQLAEANTHLKDLDKMKTEFVSLASHELLTPVSAIEGYLSMMLDEKLVTLEDPKAVQYMDRVYRSAKRLARLIADMLNISRIEEGRLAVEKKDVDMTETIKQVLEELKFKADEHKQKIVFAGQNTNNQHMTYGDPDKIKEILVNIIGNSIKYTMNPGTITVTLEKVPTRVLTSKWDKMEAAIMTQPVDNQESIHAVADEHMKKILGDEQYLIRIKDEGIGIPKDELPKLFRKFHRVGDFSTAESQGTGLGLYITRALVELHHGRVWPDSEGQGKGSTFTFSLPTFDAKKEIIALEAQTPQTKEQLKPLAKPMGSDDAL